MQDAADHTAVIYAIFAAHIRRQVWFDLPPLIVVQPKQIAPFPRPRYPARPGIFVCGLFEDSNPALFAGVLLR